MNEKRREIITGAGVVPVCISSTGIIYVLLGRERYVRNWSSSLKWSDFGGSNSGNEDEYTNASREYIEETLCLLETDSAAFADELRQKNYISKISVRNPSMCKTHVTFLKQIDYDPSLPGRFGNVIAFLNDISKLNERILNLSKMTNEEANEEEGWICVKSHDKKLLERLRNEIDYKIKHPPPGFDVNSHSALEVFYDDNGKVKTVVVSDSFLEKSQVRWWGLADIETASSYGGNGLQHASIRPYFCIIAKLLVNFLKRELKSSTPCRPRLRMHQKNVTYQLSRNKSHSPVSDSSFSA